MSSNNSFDLSIAAQNVEAKFYNKLAIVYVEGGDDKIFWSQYFDDKLFEIREVDGCKNLEDYEDDIMNHGLKCIVAKDADYSCYLNNVNAHPLIVCTLSHSIECVMYCPYNVNACLKRLARTLNDYLAEIQQKYTDFYNDAKELVVYDIANNIDGFGCSVCGDSCIPFLESNHSLKISTEKRDQFLHGISTNFTQESLDKARQLISNDKRELRQIAKGHFQTSFVVNLLKKLCSQITQGKAPTISNDALFALLIKCFPECRIDCEEKNVIKQRVNAAIAAL